MTKLDTQALRECFALGAESIGMEVAVSLLDALDRATGEVEMLRDAINEAVRVDTITNTLIAITREVARR